MTVLPPMRPRHTVFGCNPCGTRWADTGLDPEPCWMCGRRGVTVKYGEGYITSQHSPGSAVNAMVRDMGDDPTDPSADPCGSGPM